MTEEVKDNLGEVTNETLSPSEDNSRKETTEEVDEQTTAEPEVDQKELRHAQQMEGSRKETERLRNIAIAAQVKLAEADGNALLELHGTDPKLAEDVAKKFGYSSFKEAKKYLESEGIAEKQDDNEDFDTKYARRRAEEKHEESIIKADKFIDSSKLDANLKEKAKTYFEKITEGKLLDEDTAIEFAEMATLYVSKDKLKSDKLDDAKIKMASTGLSNTTKIDQTGETTQVVRNGRLVTLSSNKSN